MFPKAAVFPMATVFPKAPVFPMALCFQWLPVFPMALCSNSYCVSNGWGGRCFFSTAIILSMSRRDRLLPVSGPGRLRVPASVHQSSRRHAARDARRCRGGARRLSPVCYSPRVRCLLSERACGHAPVDGGQRRSTARQVPPRMAAAGSPPAARAAAGTHRAR